MFACRSCVHSNAVAISALSSGVVDVMAGVTQIVPDSVCSALDAT